MLSYNNKLKRYSQQLRKQATKEERRLWYDFLKTYPIQFNRQKIIGNYIVDFYCDKVQLAIELDGSQHYEDDAQIYDEERTAYLNGLSIDVLRFANPDIQRNFDGVFAVIDMRVSGLQAGRPSSVTCG